MHKISFLDTTLTKHLQGSSVSTITSHYVMLHVCAFSLRWLQMCVHYGLPHINQTNLSAHYHNSRDRSMYILLTRLGFIGDNDNM